jgi:hypothetical protein
MNKRKKPVKKVVRSFKKVDVKAPRCRLESYDVFKGKTTVHGEKKPTSFFYRMKKMYPDLGRYPDAQIKKLIVECNKTVFLPRIAETRWGLDFPAGLGHVVLATCNFVNYSSPYYERCIDHKTSGEVGEKRIYANAHSNGKVARIMYTNCATKIRFENAKYWYFSASRILKRSCSVAYRDNWSMYAVLNKVNFISTMVKQARNAWKYKNKD